MTPTIRKVTVTRYITPLREGGSLPALAEADDDFKYVIKFRGAGHGVKALISELLGGLIAKYLGLQVPELDRKSTRLNSSHVRISYAVFCLKKKRRTQRRPGQY